MFKGLVLFTLLLPTSDAQVCRLSVAGLNRARRVTGPIRAECSTQVVHTAPFGNWGVTSNYGQKGNSMAAVGLTYNGSLSFCASNCA